MPAAALAVGRRRGRVALGPQAAAGLQHAHDQGLVHRDVKPQNLLVASDGTLKISDFGIACAIEGTQITSAGTILGTAGYLAPEQAAGAEASAAADVYGLGAVLYQALTGRTPVRVESLADLPTAHLEPPDPIGAIADGVPPQVETAVMRALERRPEDRPASAAELAAALGDTRAGAPTVALPRPRPTRLRAGLLAAAAAVLVAILAVPAILVAGSGDGPAEVEPVPRHADPQQQARALAEWLRQRSGGG